jgi:hypothetical protein
MEADAAELADAAREYEENGAEGDSDHPADEAKMIGLLSVLDG